jgi:intracellular septation protein
VVLIASALLFKKNLIKAMMEQQLALPEPVWSRLNLSWAGFFTFMGGLNLYVAFNYSTEAWVNFKLFGAMGLMFGFVIAQSLILSKYIHEEETK